MIAARTVPQNSRGTRIKARRVVASQKRTVYVVFSVCNNGSKRYIFIRLIQVRYNKSGYFHSVFCMLCFDRPTDDKTVALLANAPTNATQRNATHERATNLGCRGRPHSRLPRNTSTDSRRLPAPVPFWMGTILFRHHQHHH